jgi:hypothetical protein
MQHKGLANGRWFQLSLCQQMANIGAEVGRAINWRNKDKKYSQMAVDRALELLSLSISDKKNLHGIKELTRVYEIIGDYFYGNNVLKTDDSFLERYFYYFTYAARNRRG